MPSPTLKPGAYVGRYRVEAFVDQGGMGEVYRAWDPMLEREVALKSIRLDQSRDQVSMERFQREARTLAHLNHPHICQVYDWIEVDKALFMAMEWVPGISLTEHMADPLPLPRILEILETVSEALAAAHAIPVVHRDLKPGNIRVLPSGSLKVLDFGLAKSTEERRPRGDESPTQALPTLPRLQLAGSQETQVHSAGPGTAPYTLTVAGTFMGTLGYMSPEQVLGLPVGPPSDIFALGILAHELLTGKLPFEGQGLDMLRAVAANQRVPLPGLRSGKRWPRALVALVDGMLAPKPQARPTAPELVEAFRAFRRPLSAAKVGTLATVATLLAAGSLYLLAGRGVIRDLTRERPARLVVLPIENRTGDATLTSLVKVGMTGLFGTALKDLPKVAVVDPEHLAKALLREGDAFPRLPQKDQLARLHHILGAKLFLSGSFSRNKARGTATFEFRLLDAAGKVRTSGTLTHPAGDTPLPYDFIEETVAQLERQVDPIGRGASRPNLPQFSAANLQAYGEGRELFWKGNPKAAESLLAQVAYTAPGFGAGVTDYAMCLYHLGRGDTAPVAHWALVASRAGKDRASEGKALRILSDLAMKRGDFAFAETCLRDGLALAQGSGDSLNEAHDLNNLGILKEAQGQHRAARDLYQQAIAIALREGDLTNRAAFQLNIANLALRAGDFPEAEKGYRALAQVQGSLNNPMSQAAALNNLGVALLSGQRLQEAEPVLKEALRMRVQTGQASGQVSTLRNLGILEYMRGDLEKAKAFFTRSLDLATASQDLRGQGHAHFRLGETGRRAGRFMEAERHYETAAKCFGDAEPVKRGECISGFAECLARRSPPKVAQAYGLLKSLETMPSDNPYLNRALAWVHWNEGEFDTARPIIRKSIEIAKFQTPEILKELFETEKIFSINY